MRNYVECPHCGNMNEGVWEADAESEQDYECRICEKVFIVVINLVMMLHGVEK